MKTAKIRDKAIPTLAAAIAAALAAIFIFSSLAEGREDKDTDWRDLVQERHQMTADMMGMLKETMTIIRDLNHKPSAEEKQRLEAMMGQLDDMMKRHSELAKRHKAMHKALPPKAKVGDDEDM